MRETTNSLNRKTYWQVILIAVLILSSAFILLDAFLIPKTYEVSDLEQLEIDSSTVDAHTSENLELTDKAVVSQSNEGSESNEQVINSSIEPIVTDNTYSDENISINIEKFDQQNVVFYVADIQITDVSFLKTAFANDTYGKNITETTSDMAEDNDAIFAINGDYYGFRDSGLVIRNGILYRDVSDGPSGNQSLIIDSVGNLEIVDINETSGTSLIDSGVLQGFSFGPVLVEDGQIPENFDTTVSLKANPRTAIGQISPLHYLFIVVEGRSRSSAGMTLEQLAQEFIERGATIAYNLDGGGSSSMVLNGSLINTPAEKRNNGERKISDIIYIGY